MEGGLGGYDVAAREGGGGAAPGVVRDTQLAVREDIGENEKKKKKGWRLK